jgi:hypothetical protein
MKKQSIIKWVPFFILLSVVSVNAEKTVSGLCFSPAIGLSYNPLGLLIDTKILYTSPLVKKSGLLWESTKIGFGLQNEFTPADNLLSVRLECEPIAFFDIVVKAGIFSMFDILGYGCFRMADGNSGPYDLTTQDTIGRGNAHGYWVSIAPTFKAQVSRVILLNTLAVNRIAIDGQGSFLELRSYLPHHAVDADLVNTTYALYEHSSAILAGMSLKNAYVYGTGRFSQTIAGIAIFKSRPSSPHRRFLVLSGGMYLDDPLFTNNIYLACLAGQDFKLR